MQVFPHLICTQILSGVEWRKKIWRRKIYFVSEEEKNKEGEWGKHLEKENNFLWGRRKRRKTF